MALQNIIGLETGYQGVVLTNQGEMEAQGGGTITLSSGIKRSGSYSFRVYPSGAGVGFAHAFCVSGTHSVLFTRFHLYIALLPASGSEEIFAAVTSSYVYKATVRIDSGGHLMAFASDGTTQIGSTGETALQTGTWYRVEVGVWTGNPASVQVRVNGKWEVNGTGNLTATANAGVVLGKKVNRNSQSVDFYYDNILLNNSGWLNDSFCGLMYPVANGTYTAWTGGTGNDWEIVDEIPFVHEGDSLTSTLVIGDATTVSLVSPKSVGIDGAILGIKAFFYVRRGSLSGSVKFRVRTNGSNYDSGAYSPASSDRGGSYLLETNPATGKAWTVEQLEAIEIGIVENSTNRYSLCGGMYLMVEYIPKRGKPPPPPPGKVKFTAGSGPYTLTSATPVQHLRI